MDFLMKLTRFALSFVIYFSVACIIWLVLTFVYISEGEPAEYVRRQDSQMMTKPVEKVDKPVRSRKTKPTQTESSPEIGGDVRDVPDQDDLVVAKQGSIVFLFVGANHVPMLHVLECLSACDQGVHHANVISMYRVDGDVVVGRVVPVGAYRLTYSCKEVTEDAKNKFKKPKTKTICDAINFPITQSDITSTDTFVTFVVSETGQRLVWYGPYYVTKRGVP